MKWLYFITYHNQIPLLNFSVKKIIISLKALFDFRMVIFLLKYKLHVTFHSHEACGSVITKTDLRPAYLSETYIPSEITPAESKQLTPCFFHCLTLIYHLSQHTEEEHLHTYMPFTVKVRMKSKQQPVTGQIFKKSAFCWWLTLKCQSQSTVPFRVVIKQNFIA